MKRAIFFDKDGVINKAIDRGDAFSVHGKLVRHTAPFTLEEVAYMPGVEKLVRTAHERGFLAIVVTNQPDVSYGTMTTEALTSILNDLRRFDFDDVYVCTHRRDEGCTCKKPQPGMLLDAARTWDINLAASYLIGDSASDVGAARAAGCTSVLLGAPYNADVEANIRVERLVDTIRHIA